MSPARAENVLVLVLDEQPDLRSVRRALANGRDTSVRLVAPKHVGPLHWYATDEDEAHADAESRAREAERALEPVAKAEGGAGDADPVLAVEDALADFPADRIVVVGGEDTALGESLQRFHVPVQHLGGSPEPSAAGELRETGRSIQSGRSNMTPFAVFVGAMIVLGVFVAIGLVVAALILWI